MSKKMKPKSALGWAAISEDRPPEIWHVAWYREHLPDYLKHIRVRVVPVLSIRKKHKAKPVKRGRR